MRSWSIPVGRLFGVDVRIHLTFFILPTFIFWTDYPLTRATPPDRAIWRWSGIILVVSPPMKCAHMLAARRFGLVPKAVILLPLTGVRYV